MGRISKLPMEQWDTALHALNQTDSASALEKEMMGITAHAPHMAQAMGAFMEMSMQGRKLSRRLIELVRLRVAFHNQCRTCMAVRYQSAVDDGLTEEMVCSLEKPTESLGLTEREKAALAYADLFSTNHLAIDDGMFDRLHQHYTEGEVVELMLFVSFFVGFGRFGAFINGVDELPKGFQDTSKTAAPWAIRESVVVRG